MALRDVIQLFVLGAIWGGSFLFMRVAVPVLGPLVTTELRLALGAACLLAIAVWRYRSLYLHLWRGIVVVGLFNCAIPFLCFSIAAGELPAGYLSVMNATSPCFGALFGALILGEVLTVRRTFGLILGLVGVGVLMAVGPVELTARTAMAAGYGLFASLCYGFAVTQLGPLLREAPGIVVAANTLAVSAFALAPIVYLYPSHLHEFSLHAVQAAATLGILCTAIAYLIYYDLVTRIPPTRAIVVTFLIPIFATLWGILFLGESFSLRSALGSLLALLGTYLSSQRIQEEAKD